MKNFVLIFFVALGLAIGVQDVRAQNTHNADLHPPYLAEEEPDVPVGEEIPALEEGEEGEITERGIRRFKFPGTTPKPKIKKGIKVPKFRLRRPPPLQEQQSPFDPQAYYRLTTEWQGPGRSLDIINDGQNNKPILADTGNYSGQSWRITPIGTSGYYRLTTEWQGPGRSLDIINDGQNNKPILADTRNYSGQIWKITKIGGGGDQPVVIPPTPQCVVKTSDIAMNPLIDIGYEDKQSSKWNPNDSSAQQSLMRMMSKGNPTERRAASGMVQAIKQGTLAGILRTDKQAVWARAGRLSPPQVPIHVIPSGQNAMCLKKPVGEPPMIIYRQIRIPPSVFDQLLVTVWGQCGLQTPDPPCEYVRDMGNKPELECYTHQQCMEKGLGNFCSQENTCETRIDPIPPPGPPPTSDCEEFQLEIVQIQIRIGTLQARLQEAEREKKDIEFRLDHANKKYDEDRKGGPAGGRGAWAIRVQQIEQELAAKNLEINGLQLKISQEEKLLLSKKTELQICQSASQGAVMGN